MIAKPTVDSHSHIIEADGEYLGIFEEVSRWNGLIELKGSLGIVIALIVGNHDRKCPRNVRQTICLTPVRATEKLARKLGLMPLNIKDDV